MTRRTMLQTAGGAWAAAAFRTSARGATEAASPIIMKLGAYMSEAAGRALPEEALEKTRHHILDTLAAMVSGSELAPGRVGIQFARAHAGEKVATVAATDVLCGPLEAAMANGMLAHSDETDDSHAPSHSHPGCAVVPAALAAGEQFGIDGKRFARAVALGYSRVYLRSDDEIDIYRVSLNRWELERRDGVWLIARRLTRLLGHAEAKAIFSQGLADV